MSTRIDVSNDMLTWAVSRAGLELPAFTKNFPPLQYWLDGKRKPTVKQLQEFSKKVYLPFGYLLLPQPPIEDLPIPFFRSEGTSVDKVSINVYDTILLLQQRQDWLSSYLKDNNFDPLPFVGKFSDTSNVDDIVKDIREVLNLPEEWAQSHRTWNDALNHLVAQIEDCGIVVTFNGVVENSTSRKIPVDECRGFVLVDEMSPFLFINNGDFKTAQMFTLVHELAHIWTGYSAGFDFRQMLPANNPIEKLCDKVAAEFLVPRNAFDHAWSNHPQTNILARHFKVSEIVIARRALDTGKWSKGQFFSFYNAYSKREFQTKESQGSGGDFYATIKKRISIAFATHIKNAVQSGQLLYRDAYRLTSIKGDTFDRFFSTQV